VLWRPRWSCPGLFFTSNQTLGIGGFPTREQRLITCPGIAAPFLVRVCTFLLLQADSSYQKAHPTRTSMLWQSYFQLPTTIHLLGALFLSAHISPAPGAKIRPCIFSGAFAADGEPSNAFGANEQKPQEASKVQVSCHQVKTRSSCAHCLPDTATQILVPLEEVLRTGTW
jgi:hypothetical protein